MDKPVFDIALRIITQIKRITTTEVNDFVGTFVVNLLGLKTKNQLLNEQSPLNENDIPILMKIE